MKANKDRAGDPHGMTRTNREEGIIVSFRPVVNLLLRMFYENGGGSPLLEDQVASLTVARKEKVTVAVFAFDADTGIGPHASDGEGETIIYIS